MSSPFLGQILTSIIAGEPVSARTRTKAPDVTLEPMEASAWAAWARRARDDAAAMADQPPTSPVRRDRSFRIAHGLHR